MLILKNIGPESSALLSNLSRETFIQAYKDLHSEENLEQYCRENYSQELVEDNLRLVNIHSVIAFEASEPAGFYVIRHHECPVALQGKATELKQIYVLASYFGTGLGKKLFDNGVENAKANDSRWLWLCVSDTNYRAQAFYSKLGFTKIGTGPTLKVGNDELSSSILSLKL